MKTTHVSLSTYATEEALTRVIREKSEQLIFAEIAYHDKDNKEPHRHINVQLVAPREPSDIAKWFKTCLDDKGELANTFAQETLEADKAHEYLTHKNDDTKYQYSDEVVKVLYGDLNKYLSSETPLQVAKRKKTETAERKAQRAEDMAESVDNMLNDIIEGKPMRYMAKVYGRDYIKNRKAYHDFAGDVYMEETGDWQKAYLIAKQGCETACRRAMAESYADGATTMLKHIREKAIAIFAEDDITELNFAQRKLFENLIETLD